MHLGTVLGRFIFGAVKGRRERYGVLAEGGQCWMLLPTPRLTAWPCRSRPDHKGVWLRFVGWKNGTGNGCGVERSEKINGNNK